MKNCEICGADITIFKNYASPRRCKKCSSRNKKYDRNEYMREYMRLKRNYYDRLIEKQEEYFYGSKYKNIKLISKNGVLYLK